LHKGTQVIKWKPNARRKDVRKHKSKAKWPQRFAAGAEQLMQMLT
jgi:hypothetical protein